MNLSEFFRPPKVYFVAIALVIVAYVAWRRHQEAQVVSNAQSNGRPKGGGGGKGRKYRRVNSGAMG